jgi:NAD(P)-dependent dehydrogenase (short-subunit alcohol dehydrogenase family)
MKEMFRLDGKTAFVTGAATGIGQVIAATLGRQGADVAITDRSGVSLDRTRTIVEDLGVRVVEVAIDVRDTVQIESGVQTVLAALGRIDILVNNAGINIPTPGLDVSPDNWDDHFATNVRGGFFAAQKVAPAMMANKWGRIIFISSQSGLVGIPGQPVYCSTKGAIIQLVRTLGVEWAKFGITVNSVAPTFVETNLTRKRLQNPDFLKYVLGKIPSGKLALPEDVAAAVAFLASVEAGMVNCATLTVDGGWTAW